jgi:hypothetical protein
VPWPDVGLEGTLRTWLIGSGIPRRIVRKLRRADELAARGKPGAEVAPELGASAATL